jgi:hypothetical protein
MVTVTILLLPAKARYDLSLICSAQAIVVLMTRANFNTEAGCGLN